MRANRAIERMIPNAPVAEAAILTGTWETAGNGRRQRIVPRVVETAASTTRVSCVGCTITERDNARVELEWVYHTTRNKTKSRYSLANEACNDPRSVFPPTRNNGNNEART